MTVQAARINAFRAAVAAGLKAVMPRADVGEQFGRFDLDELETNIVRAPALRVAVLRARFPGVADGAVDAALECAVFIVSDGRDRDRHGWAMAEAVANLLDSRQRWGLDNIGAPIDVTIQPAVTAKLKARAVSLMAVEWRQELRRVGGGLIDAEGHLLEELYVNGEEVDFAPVDGPSEEGEAP